jgi:hypothetical protein
MLVLGSMKSLLIALALGGTAAAAPGPDFLDHQPPTPVGADLAATAGTRTVIEPSDVVVFAHDSALLRADTLDQVDRVAQWLRAHPGYSVVLEGHTDNIGDVDYNAGLAFSRAAAVKGRLDADGIAADRIVLVAFGERGVNDRRVTMYATRLPGREIAARALRRGAARATWFAGKSAFDMGAAR